MKDGIECDVQKMFLAAAKIINQSIGGLMGKKGVSILLKNAW